MYINYSLRLLNLQTLRDSGGVRVVEKGLRYIGVDRGAVGRGYGAEPRRRGFGRIP
jgi:hypothetical protein